MRKWQKTALLAAAAVFAAWMLWPRPLAKAFDAEQGLAASVTASGVRDGRAWMDSSEQYDLEEGCAALREVLEGYSYHLCLDTLTGENAIGTTPCTYIMSAPRASSPTAPPASLWMAGCTGWGIWAPGGAPL